MKDSAFDGALSCFEGLLQRGQNFFAVAALFHVDEVDDDDAAEVAQANLADDFLHGFEVGLDDGVFEARGAFADEFAGVDVDGHERFGVVDDDVAAGLEPDFGAQRLVEFVLDAELFEDRRFLGVELDAVDELGLEAADEFDDLAVFLFVVDPDGGEIVADVIAQDALDEIEVAMEKRGRFALFAALLDFVPGVAEEFDVGANFVVGGAAGGGANDEAAGIAAAGFADETAQARAIFGGDDFARDADVIDGGHVDQEAAGQRDVAGDARALFAERLLGDLDDDFLTGLQHFGNELRAARRTGVMAPPGSHDHGAGRQVRWDGVRIAGRDDRRCARGRPPRLSGRPPRLSGRPPRLSRPRSRPPLRKGRWKRGADCRQCARNRAGNSSRGAGAPPRCAERGFRREAG